MKSSEIRPLKDFLTRKEAADMLGVTTQWISKLIRDGKLKATTSGDAPNSRKRISMESVRKLLP